MATDFDSVLKNAMGPACSITRATDNSTRGSRCGIAIDNLETKLKDYYRSNAPADPADAYAQVMNTDFAKFAQSISDNDWSHGGYAEQITRFASAFKDAKSGETTEYTIDTTGPSADADLKVLASAFNKAKAAGKALPVFDTISTDGKIDSPDEISKLKAWIKTTAEKYGVNHDKLDYHSVAEYLVKTGGQ